MNPKPEIRYVDPLVIDDETIRWIFDEHGNRTGFGQRIEMTKEDLEKMYPSEPKPNTAFKEFAKHYFPRGD